MFLRRSTRQKNGKQHNYWNIVENRRVSGGRVVQKQVLYLGEINSSQEAAWRKTIQVFSGTADQPAQTLALFPDHADAPVPVDDQQVVQIRLSDLQLHRPRQWGGCWLACQLYEELGLSAFWSEQLEPSRKGTRWDQVLQGLAVYRLLDPGSEWRLHRHWFEQSALGDLLGADFSLVEIHKLYKCLDLLLEHKQGLLSHLTKRWKDLFNASFEVLLYDLTSTYFESDPPFAEEDIRRYGYSRDKRPDCVQVVIGLIVTPEGFPLGYEVFTGNTSDRTTLQGFLDKIEQQYGKAQRIWVMDRGIPTEEVLAQMRQNEPKINYVVGTPKGRLSKLEQDLLDRSWQQVHPGVQVKLLPKDGELYVLAQSADRTSKEQGMRRRRFTRLWKRLKDIQQQKLTRDQLLVKLGAAKQQSPAAWRLVEVEIPAEGQEVNAQTFKFQVRTKKVRQIAQREGRYLLRSNLTEQDPAKLWSIYIQLTQVEEAFKNLKGDLALRPIFHQKEERIKAHIFVAFLAYCLHVSLKGRLRDLAPGLSPREVLEKLSTIKLIDVHLPTTDGRTIILPRYTQPEKDVQMLLKSLRLELPEQPPPRVASQPA